MGCVKTKPGLVYFLLYMLLWLLLLCLPLNRVVWAGVSDNATSTAVPGKVRKKFKSYDDFVGSLIWPGRWGKKWDGKVDERLSEIRKAIDEGRLDVNKEISYGGKPETPLSLAVFSVTPEIIRNDVTGEDDLYSPKVVKLLLEKGADPNKAVGGKYPLLEAIQLHALGMCFVSKVSKETGKIIPHEWFQPCKIMTKLLLDYGANPNVTDEGKNTPLMWVCGYYKSPFTGMPFFDLELAKLLVRHDANVNAVNKDGDTALLLAIKRGGSLEMIKFLLENGANPNVTDKKGYTPLFYAVGRKELDVVKVLIQHDADPNKPMFVRDVKQVMTPLHSLIYLIIGVKEIDPVFFDELEYLLKAKADPNLVIFPYGFSALDLACFIKDNRVKNKVVSILKKYGAKFNRRISCDADEWDEFQKKHPWFSDFYFYMTKSYSCSYESVNGAVLRNVVLSYCITLRIILELFVLKVIFPVVLIPKLEL